VSVTEIPERASDAASKALAGVGTTRRSFLTRVALFGSAMAVAPVRFLLRPETALGVITANCPQPNGCTSGLCTDGYSSFCCTITGSNSCPANTAPGGWWHACVPTSYCPNGTRYYIDCVGTACPFDCSACHCYGNSCSNRRTCCNLGYSNCSGPNHSRRLKCRITRCSNPCTLFGGCSCTSAEKDPVTCSHGSSTCLSAPGTSCRTRTCTP
jgi:hypothetical protein